MQLGKTIKKYRSQKGISQKKLADDAGITPSFLSLLENDKREPSFAVARRIAKELSIPIEVLIWDAVEVPKLLDASDRKQCQIAKLLVDRFYSDQMNVTASEKK